MPRCTKDNVNTVLDFIYNSPEDEFVVDIDCSDCDRLAALAEKVANGVDVRAVLPALADFIHYWRDCREEFEALVAVIKAEGDGTIAQALDQILNEVRSPSEKSPEA